MSYTITKGHGKNKLWLNLAYIKTTKCFGSYDMAWTTSNKYEALEMLREVKRVHRGAKVEEYY